MFANTLQVGGTHYIKNAYQHWDFVLETDMNYVLGCATKYVSRWRQKNGFQDLEKSKHYIYKAKENQVYFDHDKHLAKVLKFCSQLVPEDATMILAITSGDYAEAIDLIDEMLQQGEVSFARGRDGV